uniref:Uncharacterized protein n=1 Tax=Romanomermis culicivorax TaxID=13658 RepID=A0A915JZA5_ROMCU
MESCITGFPCIVELQLHIQPPSPNRQIFGLHGDRQQRPGLLFSHDWNSVQHNTCRLSRLSLQPKSYVKDLAQLYPSMNILKNARLLGAHICGGCWASGLISARKLLDWFGWNIALCGRFLS